MHAHFSSLDFECFRFWVLHRHFDLQLNACSLFFVRFWVFHSLFISIWMLAGSLVVVLSSHCLATILWLWLILLQIPHLSSHACNLILATTWSVQWYCEFVVGWDCDILIYCSMFFVCVLLWIFDILAFFSVVPGALTWDYLAKTQVQV